MSRVCVDKIMFSCVGVGVGVMWDGFQNRPVIWFSSFFLNNRCQVGRSQEMRPVTRLWCLMIYGNGQWRTWRRGWNNAIGKSVETKTCSQPECTNQWTILIVLHQLKTPALMKAALSQTYQHRSQHPGRVSPQKTFPLSVSMMWRITFSTRKILYRAIKKTFLANFKNPEKCIKKTTFQMLK